MAANPEEVGSQKVMSDFRTVIADAQELLQATASQTGERVTALRSRLEESIRAGAENMKEAERVLVDKTKAAARATDMFVQENPWKTAGIAAAIGLVIGVLISRR
ncbi:MAG: hypothetical protein A3I01_12480 [Betaproteobacteria bacterium RIFCSPLOWO2_02_FULL_65_24]|nr:MAG: hypothetical protein A3I01_12480 [Betaproteobacteria bacterium RIFCSPLOWO2_02_FULL_65_24]